MELSTVFGWVVVDIRLQVITSTHVLYRISGWILDFRKHSDHKLQVQNSAKAGLGKSRLATLNRNAQGRNFDRCKPNVADQMNWIRHSRLTLV